MRLRRGVAEQVCSGTTGHTEAVRVTFDPSETSFAALCELFWERLGDNRYLLNQVGNDRGSLRPRRPS